MNRGAPSLTQAGKPGKRPLARALGDLMDRRPKLVAQIEKAGRTRQARKTCRITPEGLRAVRQMLET